MPYSEIEAKFLGPGKELTREPCYKKLKSTADSCVFPRRGGPDNQRLQAKTGNSRASVATIHFRRRICPQEDKTESTEVLQPLQEEMPGNKPGGAESIGSQALQDGKPSPLSRDDGIYSTSKAFIGPVYKPPEKEKCRGRRAETHPLSGTEGKRRQEEKQKFNSKKLEIDTELSQFYKEIEELENENEASQGSCKEPEPSQEQIIPHDQSYNALESEEETKALRSAPQSHGYQHCVEDAPGSYPCEEEVIPAFPSFRPEWPPIHPFVLPHGPPLPSFDYHFNIERFGAPLDPLAHIFHTHADSQMRSGCYVDSCQDSWSYLTSNQMDEYANYAVTGSDFHPFRSDYSVHDDSVHSGFYETRVCWRDPPLDKHNETDRFVSQWFPEENLDKLQKLLILLRGLPGSGKTTLSRILLGQSRDGIVFSTDDYFHHQDGYRYNVNQLGDAHDWNQNRAKQAIDQGRSPVIIDNTNTQAWEMKPYVEMAIGKGYRVEFHEPETWWKFDPEELEKRNKHGVSRKKIAQMLDRYEFQMSISIVMNSVEPTQKSIQRPLPVQGEPRGRNLKKSGYRLDKSKQKRNSKGKKRSNGPSENSLGILGHPVPGDQAHSQSEGEGSEETRREPGRPVDGGLQKDSVAKVELGLTPKSSFPSKEEEGALCLPSLSVLSGSSASCHRSSQHFSSVGRVERHRRNRHNSAFGTRDMLGKAPFPFMQKKEMMDRPEFAVHPQGGTSTSKELSREERGVKSDGWAFFTASLCDEDSQLRSESQPYLGSWPEGPHKFVCEQRRKKGRSGRLSCPGSEEQLVTVISTSEGAAGLRGGPEIPKEKKLLAGLPPEAEIVDLPRSPGTDISSSPEHPLEPAEGTYGTQRKVCNLPPHFKLLGQTPINLKEKEEYDVLTESHRQNIFFLGKDTSEIVNKDETVQKMATSDRHLLWFYFDTLLHGSPLSIVRQSGPYRLSFFRLGYAVYFYKNPAPSLMLHYLSGFCVISFNNRRTRLTFNSQKMVSRKLTEEGLVPVEGLSSQPHTFHSFRISSESQFSNERLDEKLRTPQGWEPAQCSPAEDSHELTRRNRQPLEPLSQGFAFHPVRCFGSSTVPIESLSPDDQPRDSM